MSDSPARTVAMKAGAIIVLELDAQLPMWSTMLLSATKSTPQMASRFLPLMNRRPAREQ